MKAKHFAIHELVDPWFLTAHSESDCWAMLDPQAVAALDTLRDKFGPLLVNGRGLKERGLRRRDTPTGAKYSQHKEGRAFDVTPLTKGVTVHAMFTWTTLNPKDAYAMGIRRVEDIAFTGKGNWLHFDTKDTGAANVGKIVIVKP